MKPLRFLLRHRLVLLAASAAAFAAWVWHDATRDAPQPLSPHVPRPLPLAVAAAVCDADVPAPVPAGNVRVPPVQRLRVGMTRPEAERVVGAPAGDATLPAAAADGRVTYRTVYGPADRPTLTLEFDATRPGHRLIGVQCPDPQL